MFQSSTVSNTMRLGKMEMNNTTMRTKARCSGEEDDLSRVMEEASGKLLDDDIDETIESALVERTDCRNKHIDNADV